MSGDGLSFDVPGHESASAELRRVRAELGEARAELRALTETDDARLASAEAESARAQRERKEMYEALHSAVWQRDLARAELESARQEVDRLRAGNAERYRQGALDAAGAVARVYRDLPPSPVPGDVARRCYRAALAVADPQPGTPMPDLPELDTAHEGADMDAKQIRDEIDTYLGEHDLKLIRLPIDDALERRAICLKLALETKGVAFSLRNDAGVAEAADGVIEAAKHYEAYITGEALS